MVLRGRTPLVATAKRGSGQPVMLLFGIAVVVFSWPSSASLLVGPGRSP